MKPVAVIALAYLIGSIPFAFLLARRRGVDLRMAGSRNVGASNVLRTSGVPVAIVAMLLDGLKGALAVLLAELASPGPVTVVVAALASMAGHIYPVWLRFRGGKGVATAAGAFTVLAPAALVMASAVFVIAVAVTRFISAGSIAGAVTLAVATAASGAPLTVVAGAILAAGLIVHRHRGNLARLVAGTERRVGERRVH
jgi:glycerol-3-phosphate acyltransferase PlsY